MVRFALQFLAGGALFGIVFAFVPQFIPDLPVVIIDIINFVFDLVYLAWKFLSFLFIPEWVLFAITTVFLAILLRVVFKIIFWMWERIPFN